MLDVNYRGINNCKTSTWSSLGNSMSLAPNNSSVSAMPSVVNFLPQWQKRIQWIHLRGLPFRELGQIIFFLDKSINCSLIISPTHLWLTIVDSYYRSIRSKWRIWRRSSGSNPPYFHLSNLHLDRCPVCYIAHALLIFWL